MFIINNCQMSKSFFFNIFARSSHLNRLFVTIFFLYICYIDLDFYKLKKILIFNRINKSFEKFYRIKFKSFKHYRECLDLEN